MNIIIGIAVGSLVASSICTIYNIPENIKIDIHAGYGSVLVIGGAVMGAITSGIIDHFL